MSRKLFVWLDGGATGPFEEGDIRERVVSGVLPPTALARGEFSGQRDWEPIGQLLAKRDQVDSWVSRTCASGPPQTKSDKSEQFTRAGIILLTAFALIAAIIYGVTRDGPDWNREPSRYQAYAAAREFAFAQLPGAKEIASSSDSVVEKEGSTYRVGFRVDGLNAFGGPVRRTVAVEMRYDGSSFRFVRLIQ